MADFVTLSCPSCGGKLEITSDLQRFACGYCGSEHVVRRGGGIIALMPIVEGLSRIQEGTDKTASELAIRRLKDEIAETRQRIDGIAESETGIGWEYRRCRALFRSQPSYEDVIDKMQLIREPPTGLLRKRFEPGYQESIKLMDQLMGLVGRLRDRERQLARHQEIVNQ